MPQWARVHGPRVVWCGRCGEVIPDGAPMLVFTLKTGTKKTRCAKCEGPAPPDLPAVVEHTPEPVRQPVAVKNVAAVQSLLPPDWGARRVGERDPGEEG